MAGVYKLDIAESAEDLKQLLRSQKSASDKERIQLLDLLKSEQAQTVQAAALLMRERLQEMTQAVIRSIVGRASILEALSVAGL